MPLLGIIFYFVLKIEAEIKVKVTILMDYSDIIKILLDIKRFFGMVHNSAFIRINIFVTFILTFFKL